MFQLQAVDADFSMITLEVTSKLAIQNINVIDKASYLGM
jgi:hypothetical protein